MRVEDKIWVEDKMWVADKIWVEVSKSNKTRRNQLKDTNLERVVETRESNKIRNIFIIKT